MGWTAPARRRATSPELVALRRDVAPEGCGRLVAIFVVRAGRLRELEHRVRAPARDVTVRVRGGGRDTTVDATVRHSRALFQRVRDGAIIGNGSAVSIAEVRAMGTPRSGSSRAASVEVPAGPGGAPGAGAEIGGPCGRSTRAGLALRLHAMAAAARS